jgi:S1-C subfamily serine protease
MQTGRQPGLILDAPGHILVPTYIAGDASDARRIAVTFYDGRVAPARFVGSDLASDLTLLKLDTSAMNQTISAGSGSADGTMTLCSSSLSEGTLVLFQSASGPAQLQIWTNSPVGHGIVWTMDGRVAGLVRYGRFLSADACIGVVRQLVQTGRVERPLLGVVVRQVAPAYEYAVMSGPLANVRQALRVEDVALDSPAQSAGIQVGDLILKLDDRPAGDLCSFAAVMAGLRDSTRVQLVRDGRLLTVATGLRMP